MANFELINKSISLTHCFSLKEKKQTWELDTNTFSQNSTNFWVNLKVSALWLQIERVISE